MNIVISKKAIGAWFWLSLIAAILIVGLLVKFGPAVMNTLCAEIAGGRFC